jgi:putative MATE family efflux protein
MPAQPIQSEKLQSIGTASIPRLILVFSVPAIISMIVESLYNIVDRYFVGIGVGYLGIAGITLCFPIMLFIMAMSMIVGIGGNTLFAIRLGAKKYSQASLILNNSFALLIIMGFSAFALGELLMDPLLRSFGASEATLPYAKDYLRIILLGSMFSTITPGMNQFIRSMGHPKTAMFRNLIGAGLNTVLDALFILKFHWGIQGAAWATFISQLVTSAFVMEFFFKRDTPIKIRRRSMALQFPYVRRIFIMGFPPSVMQICNSLMNVILSRSLAHYGNLSVYGGDMAISAFGIVNSIAMVAVMPIMGFVQGAQPIIGYNYGAHNYPRVRKTLKYVLFYSVGFMCLEWIVIQVNAGNFAGSFAAGNSQLQELASRSLRTFLFALPLIGAGMTCGNFFQGTGKPIHSLILNMSRQVLILIPMLLIIPRFLGLRGVFMAGPVADTCAAILSAVLLSRELKRMRKED